MLKEVKGSERHIQTRDAYIYSYEYEGNGTLFAYGLSDKLLQCIILFVCAALAPIGALVALYFLVAG